MSLHIEQYIEHAVAALQRLQWYSLLTLDVVQVYTYFSVHVDIQAKLEKMQSNLQQCWKSLLALLERRQQKFPRFYFLSPEDVLHIVCNGAFN